MNPLDRYVAFMETVEAFDLDKLEDLIGENIHFVDPFNDTLGRSKYRAIIELENRGNFKRDDRLVQQYGVAEPTR